MATALFSGCDFYAPWSTEATDVANTVYAGTNQNGSTGPAAGTKMSFVGRYPYKVTKTELNNLLAAGLSVFWFYENSNLQPSVNPTGYLNFTNFNQGVVDAQDAQTTLTNLGISTINMPVYFAIDYDAGASQINYIIDYFDGITSVMGQANTGLYGNVYVWNNLATGNPGEILASGTSFFCQSRSSAWNGNGNYVSGQNLWQWPPGYSPSGGLTINGHGVDGEFAYTSDFGQYPRPGSGGGGGGASPQLNFATVTFPTAVLTQAATQTIAAPKDNYDKVVFSTTFTTSVANTTGSYTVPGPGTGLTTAAYPFGNFSYDNGNTFNDFGFIFAGDFGSFFGDLPYVVMQPIVSSSGALSFSVAVNGSIPGIGNTINLTVNVALISEPSLPTLPNGTSVEQTLAYGNVKNTTSVGSYGTYRRINSEYNLAANPSNIPINHNLGEIPNVMFWNEDSGGNVFINPVRWQSTGNIANEFGMKMNSSQIIVFVDSSLARCHLRVYEDN